MLRDLWTVGLYPAPCFVCGRDAKQKRIAIEDGFVCGEECLELYRRGEMRMPASPTRYGPGTKEKVEVMRQRCERGESLFHPDDNPMCTRIPLSNGGQSRLWKGWLCNM